MLAWPIRLSCPALPPLSWSSQKEGQVFDKICKDGPFSEADAADVVRQVALGLAFIHTAGVVHRDLKPENLLLTSKGVVKLADFGLAEWCGPNAKPLTEIVGTAAYMAPEVIAADDGDGPAYNEQCDVFSLGCVLFSLLAGYQAFDPKSDGDWEKTMERVEKNQWSFTAFPERWKVVSNPAKQLIRSLLEPKASKRLTADKVLTQKWVSGEGVAKEPLPGSDVQLKHFYHGRRVWREAAEAATVFAKALSPPCTRQLPAKARAEVREKAKRLPPSQQRLPSRSLLRCWLSSRRCSPTSI